MFDLLKWDGFSDIKKVDLDYMLDITALNKKMADHKDNPYRWRVGSFHVPKEASEEQKRKAVKLASDKFIQAQDKQGWELKSKIQAYGPFTAFDLLYQVIMFDMEEIRIRGIFKLKETPKPVRIELPPELIRQNPEQKLDLVGAMKASGIKSMRKSG